MSLKESNEITVKIKCELNEFYKIVKEKGFKIIDKLVLRQILDTKAQRCYNGFIRLGRRVQNGKK